MCLCGSVFWMRCPLDLGDVEREAARLGEVLVGHCQGKPSAPSRASLQAAARTSPVIESESDRQVRTKIAAPARGRKMWACKRQRED